MASVKAGLSYYNVETDRYQDIRIKRLKKEFGCTGIAVYDYILCEIYRVKGCFIMWDESTAFDVAEYFGLKDSTVGEIVNYCCFVGLFDKGMRTSGSILTSASIQRRYFEMCRRAKRKDIKIPEEYKIIPEEYDIIPEECHFIPEVCRKGKERREEKNKSFLSLSGQTSLEGSIEITEGEIKEKEKTFFLEYLFFKKRIINPKVEIDRFLAHYERTGWKDKNGNKIINRLAALISWKSPDGISKIPETISDKWEKIYDSAKKISDESIVLIAELKSIEIDGNKIVVAGTRSLIDFIEDNAETLRKPFQQSFPGMKLEYVLLK